MKTVMIIALGGAAGSVARYGVQVYVYKLYPFIFPIGTFLVNILGCLLIGIIYGLSEKGNLLTPELRMLLTTGFCGGFTTFSTFAYENVNLLSRSDFPYAGIYTLGSVILGIAGVYLGILVVKSF